MRVRSLLTFLCVLLSVAAFAQTGTIKGRVFNTVDNKPVVGATVVVQNTQSGAVVDADGNFAIPDLKTGVYTVVVSLIGFNEKTVQEVQVSNAKPTVLEVALEESSQQLKQVVVKTSPFRKTEESPTSLQTIGAAEIQRAPGGNRDISKVIQSLPGVTTTGSFRNDLLIRGGASGENRFYLDDVEVPNINHFATQGGSGGPVGLINVDFVREVDFYSGAFPASRGNALSSVFNFRFKDGRTDRLGATITAGTNDIGATLEGPINKETSFLASARRSNLQTLFTLIGLPFLPIYNDFQYKVKRRIGTHHEIEVLGLGAIDNFALNKAANKTDAQKTILDYIRPQTQWNYTQGFTYKYFHKNGFLLAVLSRNMLNNESEKYEKNDETNAAGLLTKYKSQEAENKARIEHTQTFNGYKLQVGISYELDRYYNSTYNRVVTQRGNDTIRVASQFYTIRYGAFAQISKRYLDDRLTIGLGARIDAAGINASTQNPFNQFSPRLAISYAISERLSANFNTGIYYQLPPYTALGYTENGVFVNRDRLTYIKNEHLVAGLEYSFKSNSRVKLEAYYKNYTNYPYSTRNGLSLANLGADFGVVGNEALTSTSNGRTYGVEASFQQRFYKGFYGVASYTYGYSEFQNGTGDYTPSSWDTRHIFSIVVGKRFESGWEFGLKWRYQAGLPYTPFDANRSSLAVNWDNLGQGVLDYSRVNTLRYNPTSLVDFRIDKKWFFKRWNIDVYCDIQNALNYKSIQSTYYVVRDANGNPVRDPNDAARYQLKLLDLASGTLTPSLGIIFEF